jgi:glycosyltransferase involved in cell wall biosynthesis
LEALGVDPDRVVVAGRRPPPVLRRHAARAGVDLRADVPDLTGVLAEAAVVICPVIYGSGVQNKVLDAVGAGRACVLTPFSNQALNLVDGESALVRERHPEGFADAIVALLGDGSRRRRLADHARPRLQSCSGPAVAAAWRESLQTARHRLSQET